MRDRLRAFASLTYYDPRDTLLRFRPLETDPEWQKKPPNERALRTNAQRKLRESREAALFCYAMSQRTGRAIGFAPDETQDHDFVARWDVDGQTAFFPVQLKSAVTHDGRDCASIEEVLAELEGKYAPTSKLTIAIYLTQRVRFVPSELKAPKLSVAAPYGQHRAGVCQRERKAPESQQRQARCVDPAEKAGRGPEP
jgi:hypothetical protein